MVCNKDTVFLHLPTADNVRTMSREKVNSSLIGKFFVQKSTIFEANRTVILAHLGLKLDSRSGQNDTKIPERQFYSSNPFTKYQHKEDDIKTNLLRIKTSLND